jgi:hypothetical protein
MTQRKRNQYKGSRQRPRNITVRAVRRETPDYRMLARAVVDLAKQMEAEDRLSSAGDSTDDASQCPAA